MEYEVRNFFWVKLRRFQKKSQKNLKICKQSPKLSVNYVVEITKLNNALMKESLVWEWIPLVLTQKIGSLTVRVKGVDYSKPQLKQPSIRKPAQSVNGITNLMGYHHTRDRLTPENLLELDPRKDQLGMGHKQILPDPKTKVWVDEQNKINKEKTLRYD